MASNSVYKTLGSIRTAVLADFKEATGSALVALVDRWINEGQENVILRRKRDYLNKTFHVALEAQVDTTCAVTNGSATVGSVTATSALPITSAQEHKFAIQGFQEVYDVSSFTSASITLASPFQGTTSTSATGIFFQSSVLIDADIRSIWQAYHEYNNYVVEPQGIDELRALIQTNPSLCDYAQYWALNGLDLDSGADQHRLILWPYPKNAYTLHLDTNLYIPVLEDDDDEPLIPLQHRQILYWYGLQKLAVYHNDQSRANLGMMEFNTWLAKIDGEFLPDQGYPRISQDKNLWIGRSNQRLRGKITFLR